MTLLIIGFSLTFAPVVYVALERLIFVKVAAVLVLVVLAAAFAIRPESWAALPEGFTHIGTLPAGLGIALLFSAIAFAGSGGGAESLPEQLDSRQRVRHGAGTCRVSSAPSRVRRRRAIRRRGATSSR